MFSRFLHSLFSLKHLCKETTVLLQGQKEEFITCVDANGLKCDSAINKYNTKNICLCVIQHACSRTDVPELPNIPQSLPNLTLQEVSENTLKNFLHQKHIYNLKIYVF